MLIDWFTVGAQIFNFLILVVLLRRFLYRPILKTIRQRNELIKARLDEAQQTEAQARKLIEEYELKNDAWQEEKEILFHETRKDVEELRKQLLRKARQEVEHNQTQWEQALQQEKESFLEELRQRISQQTYKIARRVLTELADANLETHIAHIFINRLRLLDDEKVETIKTSLGNSRQAVIIRSAYEIPRPIRELLETTLRSRLLHNQPIAYELTPELSAGIELRIPGQKLSWNLHDYFETLQEDVFVGLLESGDEKQDVER